MIIDLDKKQSDQQRQLVKKYCEGYIPHVVVLDGSGKAIYLTRTGWRHTMPDDKVNFSCWQEPDKSSMVVCVCKTQ